MSLPDNITLKSLGLKLEPLRIKSLLRLLRGASASASPDLILQPGEACFLRAAASLKARNPVDASQQAAILENFCGEIVAAGNQAYAAIRRGDAEVPACTLAVADGTFAMVTGSIPILDLRTGETVANMKKAPIELVCYNIAAIAATLGNSQGD